jgi:hypothetical protein
LHDAPGGLHVVRKGRQWQVHKLPILLSRAADRVQLVTLALEPTGQVFARFLQDLARLLSHLPGWTIVGDLAGVC